MCQGISNLEQVAFLVDYVSHNQKAAFRMLFYLSKILNYYLCYITDEQGEAFLADFGISRNLQGQTTLLTEAFGTPCWFASECFKADGKPAIYKKASDIQVRLNSSS